MESTIFRPPGSAPLTVSDKLLLYTHYIYPGFLFVFFLVSLTWWGIATSPSRQRPPSVKGVYNGGPTGPAEVVNGKGWFQKFAARFPDGENSNKAAKGNVQGVVRLTAVRKAVFNWLLVGIIVTFLGDATNVVLHALTNRGWWCGKDYVLSTVSLMFIYGLLLISQLDDDLAPSFPHFATWIVGLIGESVLLAAKIIAYQDATKHLGSTDLLVLAKKPREDYRSLWGHWEIVGISIDVTRLFFLTTLVVLYILLVVLPVPASQDADAEESTSLLASSSVGAGYGSVAAKAAGNREAGWERKTVVGKQSWWEYLRGYAIFFPYLWPSKQRKLQVLMVMCFTLVILQRGVNVLVPHQLGKITDILGGENGEAPRLPYVQIVLYIIYRFLQGNMGLLGAMRSTLWIPIGQYSYQALSTSAFEHVHSLSLDFHLGKKTGEVLSALSKGNAINTFLEQVSFQVVPMLVDLGVAVAYFLVEFDAYYALIVAIVTFCYIYITVRMAQWRADMRREMVNKSRDEDAVKNDSMVAYETVKYFNAESYEFNRYRGAVRAYQKAEYMVLLSLNAMNVTQNLVFMVGLVIASFLSAWQVSMGEVKVGRFVTLLAYLAQLQGPLNFFGTFYRSIQSSMINAERMLELFNEKPTVVDAPHAKRLDYCEGEIAFRNVHFAYDARKPALKGLDFVAKPGTTTAFVGESGGGKTTILRLLFRFYNIQEGSIEIDGKDVRDLTIDSVRENIGVVPQDTVLFNETIMYNIKYANPNATEEQVYDACRAASIHDKILTFPDGYNTKVGERGLRLSGGEKQRVAIARTILKNPKIILLDEATAALDSETEQNIQAALKELAKGRTTLVIAHRLSTITDANQILCIHDGQVVEAGTHEELLALNGRYAMMWAKQIRAEKREKRKAELDKDSVHSDEDSDDAEVPPKLPVVEESVENIESTPEISNVDTPVKPVVDGKDVESTPIEPVVDGKDVESTPVEPVVDGKDMESTPVEPVVDGKDVESTPAEPVVDGKDVKSTPVEPVVDGKDVESTPVEPVVDGKDVESTPVESIVDGKDAESTPAEPVDGKDMEPTPSEFVVAGTDVDTMENVTPVPSEHSTPSARPSVSFSDDIPKEADSPVGSHPDERTSFSSSGSGPGKRVAREGMRRSESGHSIAGASKWSAKGLRKALGKRGATLHRRSVSMGGAPPEGEGSKTTE
ncbi:ATP-binding cassette-type vacuolar membrane transporter Hmt1 [Rhizina undulata]